MRSSALTWGGIDGQSDGCSTGNESWSRHKGCAGLCKVFQEAKRSRVID